MFRKTHFKPKLFNQQAGNPERRVWPEEGKLTGLKAFKRCLKVLLHRDTRLTFGLMILLLSLSVITYTYSKFYMNKNFNSEPLSNELSLNYGVPEILNSAAELKDLLMIQDQVTGILAKESLSAADSLRLKQLISRMKRMYQTKKETDSITKNKGGIPDED